MEKNLSTNSFSNSNLNQLVAIPEEKRDRSWENQFFQKLTAGNIKIMTADPQQGPDGWPYLLVETDESATEPVQNLLHWCATKGVGLVINPTKEYPDFVFSYGMIWNFRQTGYFYLDQVDVKAGVVELNRGEQFISGTPSETYLPLYVRKILREFFRDQGLLKPRILMVSEDKGVHFDLCFSLESLGNPPEKEHQGILEALSWFLPPHYSLMLIREKNLPEFADL